MDESRKMEAYGATSACGAEAGVTPGIKGRARLILSGDYNKYPAGSPVPVFHIP
ncbi:hypothetical protein PISMIDRAFT_532645 [Pisolithus microcarpus 441]|uniref:Uncharacterized protein n=1 Tax=Pisolithus microcarpus 441 TaxID=765257 RepID=A0A0C9ZQE9_9AGAM|nr:hypothetical protein PISMIDRAFT_532645 [Pisolithus microcarpus 441]